jgi:hypothetical protein
MKKINIYGFEMEIQPDGVVRTFRKMTEASVLLIETQQDGKSMETPINVYKAYGCSADEFMAMFVKECHLANGGKERPNKA